jgi:hypothetical protein
MCTEFWFESLKGRDHPSEDTDLERDNTKLILGGGEMSSRIHLAPDRDQ